MTMGTGFPYRLMERLAFPEAAIAELSGSLSQAGDMSKLLDSLFDDACPADDLYGQTQAFASERGLHDYTAALCLLLAGTERLKALYAERGIEEQVFWNTVQDLRYKLNECYDVYGIWGTFVFSWFPGFFRLKRFGLGRFQYDIATYNWNRYAGKGHTVEKGDRVYNCHIPSSGPLSFADRMDSYQRAQDFFRERPLVVICDSWLLYPPHTEFLPPHSNIRGFMEDFDILTMGEEETFTNAWRVFGKAHSLPPDQWPTDTSLRRAYVERLRSGGKTGGGQGILLFDNGTILR